MNKRLLILVVLMVMVPAGVLSWFGYRFVAQEESIHDVRFNKLVLAQLQNIDQDIQNYMLKHQQAIGSMLSEKQGVDEWRILQEQYPVIRQTFLIDSRGDKLYPIDDDPLTRTEQAFLQRSQILWQDQRLFKATSVSVDEEKASSRIYSSLKSRAVQTNRQGWYSWYWGNGMNIIYWKQTANGNIIGADLDTTRIKSDVINLLPDTSTTEISDDLIKLIDSSGELVYQWNNFDPDKDALPAQRLSLSLPLNGWSLEYYAADTASLFRIQRLNIFGMIALFIVLLGFIAYYLYKESRRDAAQAIQKVNFVNQVSHELKTPLTNIRMYSEMLEDVVDDSNPNAEHYLNVITTESQRLSRLITNVLSFGRHERKVLQLQTWQGSIATIIKKCIETFEPILKQKEFEIVYSEKKCPDVVFDPDALEQILNNLISNVEKYAADGQYLEIQHDYTDDITTIRVIDHGPGIPQAERTHVFDPFYRINDQVSEGVTGTGIGLNIALQLAKLHGGTIQIIETTVGTCLELTLVTPVVETKT